MSTPEKTNTNPVEMARNLLCFEVIARSSAELDPPVEIQASRLNLRDDRAAEQAILKYPPDLISRTLNEAGIKKHGTGDPIKIKLIPYLTGGQLMGNFPVLDRRITLISPHGCIREESPDEGDNNYRFLKEVVSMTILSQRKRNFALRYGSAVTFFASSLYAVTELGANNVNAVVGGALSALALFGVKLENDRRTDFVNRIVPDIAKRMSSE